MTRMRATVVLLGAALLVTGPGGARADTIVFRSGERLSGVIVAEQPETVIFDSQALGRIEVPRERIASLDRDPVPASGKSADAGAEAAGTNEVRSRDFLRFYTDHGICYEYVQPVPVVDPFHPRTNLFSEDITISGRIGIKASFDAADYISTHGQQPVDAGAEVRTFRIYTSGEFSLFRTNLYDVDLGLASGSFYLHNAYLRLPQVPWLGNVTLGYFNVPQTIDNIVPFGANTFMEAASPGLAFSPGQRLGIQFDRTFFDERMSAQFGLFSVSQDASLKFGDASDALARPTLRVTGLLIDEPDQRRLLHIGGSASLVFSDASDIQYQARPESDLAPILVNTGPIPAQFAYVGGLEAIYQEGPFGLQSELMGSQVNGDGNCFFWGGYVSGGWFLTGEQRSYDRALGLPGRVRPNSPFSLRHGGGWGAFELALRYSYLDLNSGAVNGGRMNILMPGVNWYWTEHLRWQFNYGFAHVVEGHSPGNLNIFQMRLQWIF
ncbi:MAG: porin [Verrucomicrobiia bacterium]|jgi:phosphate-selective porin OprO/OprP